MRSARRIACVVLVLVAACGDDASYPPTAPRGSRAPAPTGGGASPARSLDDVLAIPTPNPRVRSLLQAEVLSENLASWLAMLGDKLLVRDFDGLVPSIAPDFRGQTPYAAVEPESTSLPHGAERWELLPELAPAAGRAEWIASLFERLGPWRRLELCHFSLGEAEFQIQAERRVWGAVAVGLHLVGITEGGGREALIASFRARAILEEGTWQIDRLRLLDGELSRSPRTWFADVTRSAGVHHEGIRYGQPGNDTDAWNGLACADVDGDGWPDVFVPGSTRSFLYRNRGDGTFAEEAAERGLADDGGGTGAVFFDYDGDGDQDLAVAHVGWHELDLTPAGRSLRLYANDGEGRFRDATAAAGFGHHLAAFSLVAFDADGDGWTDVFACGYGRMEDERNDSWVQAANGASDLLLMNRGGRFEDGTAAAGMRDRRWGYAAAAADFDRDGDQDLYVANNFGTNRLWRNAGDGTFEDAAVEMGVADHGLSMGVSWADLTGDGRLDLFLTQPTSHAGHRILDRLRERDVVGPIAMLERMAAGNALYVLGDGGRFEERAGPAGVGHAGWAWGSACVDLDLDGALDAFCANGFVTGDLPQDT